MIRIVKKAAPTILTTLGAAATAKDQTEFDNHTADYRAGTRKFNIDSAIYGGNTVKSALKRVQHSKCCYCEKMQKDEFGEVEHYRPKSGYYRFAKDRMQKPGYFWLGYAWSNLYFICKTCNTFKSCKFYLSDETQRANTSTDNLSLEEPLMLDPGGTADPRLHIIFHKEVAVGQSDAGKTTIAGCKLNRSTLLESRRKVAHDLNLFINIIKKFPPEDPLVIKTKGVLKGKIRRSAEFSAMVSDYLREAGIAIN